MNGNSTVKRIPVLDQDPITIEVSLERYQLFASNAEIVFTITSTDHKGAIDQLVAAIEYWSRRDPQGLQTRH